MEYSAVTVFWLTPKVKEEGHNTNDSCVLPEFEMAKKANKGTVATTTTTTTVVAPVAAPAAPKVTETLPPGMIRMPRSAGYKPGQVVPMSEVQAVCSAAAKDQRLLEQEKARVLRERAEAAIREDQKREKVLESTLGRPMPKAKPTAKPAATPENIPSIEEAISAS